MRDRTKTVTYMADTKRAAAQGDQAPSVEQQRTDGRPSVSKPYFTQTMYKFPDGLVGGSDSAFVSTAAELEFNRNPAIHPP